MGNVAGDSRRSRSPFSQLESADRTTLALLALIGVVQGVALVLLAEAVSGGIVSISRGTDEWRSVLIKGALAAVLRAGAVWATTVVAEFGARDAQVRYRRQIVSRLLRGGGKDLPLGVGDATTLATSGLAALDAWYARFLPALVATCTIPIVVGTRILWADWLSALIIVLTIPLIPVFMILIGLETRAGVQAAASSLAKLSNHLVELARGLPVLVGLGRAEAQTAALRDMANAYRERTMSTLRMAFMSSLALDLISTLAVALVAVVIGVRLVNGSVGLETGLLVLVLAPECYLPLRRVGAAFHAAEDGLEARDRVARIVATPDGSQLARSLGEGGRIDVAGLKVTYDGRSAAAFDTLSFSVQPGTMVLVGGPSGAGKSTVLAALAGLLPSNSAIEGSVDGLPLDSISYLPQQPILFADRVDDEIRLYGNVTRAEDVQRLLDLIDAGHLAERHPAELSPGEIRRVAVARSIAGVESGSTVLLLDEPTAHLDSHHAEQVIAALANLRGRVTMLVASHDARFEAFADQHVFVRGGRDEISARLQRSPASGGRGERQLPLYQPEGFAIEVEREAGWRDLVQTVRPFRREFLLASFAAILATISAVALASLSGWLIVRASEQPPILYLLGVIVGVRFFGVGRSVLRYAERLWSHDAILRSMADLRIAVWEALAAQGPAVARRLRGDRAVDHLIRDVDIVRDRSIQVVMPLVAGVAVGLFAIAGGAVILPTAGVLLALCLLVSVAGGGFLALRVDGAARSQQVLAESRVTRLVGGIANAAVDLKANHREADVLERMAVDDAVATRAARRTSWAFGLSEAVVTVSCIGTSLLMLWLAADAHRAGEISTAMAAVLVLGPLALIEPFVAAVEAIQRWPPLRLVLGRFVTDIEDGERLRRAAAGGTEGSLERIDAIRLEGVSVRWPGHDRPVLRNVSVALERGHWLAVTGPSGSGKSTLLALLMAFLRPENGRFLINVLSTDTLAAGTIRRHVAWCPQDAHLFDSTLRANLLIARPRNTPPTEDEMQSALTRVGLADLLLEMENGWDTRIGSGGSTLSGGQRQRLAVARMLLSGADLLLIDEPTAHLDSETADRMMADLRGGLTNRLGVLVSHRAADIDERDLHLELY